MIYSFSELNYIYHFEAVYILRKAMAIPLKEQKTIFNFPLFSKNEFSARTEIPTHVPKCYLFMNDIQVVQFLIKIYNFLLFELTISHSD